MVAGGCFWGLELAYQRQVGVTHTSVGYTAGRVPNPSYEEVCSGRTGHTEAVQVLLGPSGFTVNGVSGLQARTCYIPLMGSVVSGYRQVILLWTSQLCILYLW